MLSLIVSDGAIWFISHNSLRQTIKYTLIIVSIFAISFSAFEGYMFQNAGYPPNSDNSQQSITCLPNILNVSLIDIIQDIKDTPTFHLLMLEHPGEVTISHISLRDDSVTAIFSMGSSTVVSFDSFGDNPYHVTYVTRVSLTNSSSQQQTPNEALQRLQPVLDNSDNLLPDQQQTPNEALQQIDSLGLQWYYNRAIEAYQNKKGTNPEITNLQISAFVGEIGWTSDETSYDYYGMILQMVGSYEDDGGYGHDVFLADFQPDGTLIIHNVLT